MFGLLYTANLVDNSNEPWKILAFCEVACALLLSWESVILYIDTDTIQSYYDER